jgi:hypothetical protein
MCRALAYDTRAYHFQRIARKQKQKKLKKFNQNFYFIISKNLKFKTNIQK